MHMFLGFYFSTILVLIIAFIISCVSLKSGAIRKALVGIDILPSIFNQNSVFRMVNSSYGGLCT